MWWLSNRFDPAILPLADRHYNRQKPGTPQFVPPGRCLVLKTRENDAFWVTSWPLAEWTKHEWAGAWVCSAFRNENREAYLSSDLIRQAVAATLWRYGNPPELGMVTFIDKTKTRKKRDPGRCYRKAGFKVVGETKSLHLVALQLLPVDMPEPEAPMGTGMELFTLRPVL